MIIRHLQIDENLISSVFMYLFYIIISSSVMCVDVTNGIQETKLRIFNFQ